MIEFVDLIHINVPHSELPFGLPRHTRGVIGISRIRGLSEEADSVNARRLECRRSLRYPAAVQMHTIGEGMGIDPPNNEVEYVFLWSYEPDQYPAFMSILPPTCPLPGGNGELRAMTEFKVPSFDW